jgi:hypothetical protein
MVQRASSTDPCALGEPALRDRAGTRIASKVSFEVVKTDHQFMNGAATPKDVGIDFENAKGKAAVGRRRMYTTRPPSSGAGAGQSPFLLCLAGCFRRQWVLTRSAQGDFKLAVSSGQQFVERGHGRLPL